MGDKRLMPRWVRLSLDSLLAIYCVFGAYLIDKHLLGGDLSGIRFAITGDGFLHQRLPNLGLEEKFAMELDWALDVRQMVFVSNSGGHIGNCG